MKISIIGAGIMGLSTAWALERLGHQVTVFEQGPVPNPLGSSVDSHRLIRYAYGTLDGYMRMVGDSYAIWDQLWADLGETHYVPTGTLCLAGEATQWHRQSAAALEKAGHQVEWLELKDVEKRFPLIRADGVSAAFHLPTGGVLLADRIVAALAKRLAARGVEIRPHTRVTGIDPDRGFVTLEGGAVVGADWLVVAGGAWAPRLVPALAQRVVPSKQAVAYLTPPDDLAALWHQGPMLLDIDEDSGFYAVPPVAGTGLKVSDHRFSRTGDPDGDRTAYEAELAQAFEACRARLTRFSEYQVAQLKTCFYTVEPQERFIIEPLGLAAIVMSPCSGHGFKFGPLLGSAVAGAIDRGDPGDIALWASGEAA
jgi:glycine/D-amino acid oxidase-like deaminating enzyme